jgi:hypothetical protein
MPNDYKDRWGRGNTGGGFDDGPNMGKRYNDPGTMPREYRETRAPMTREEELRHNIESALRPLYDESIAQLEAQRLAQNAAIDVDAYSRGMGGSTWVTDAKLQALRGINANIASLESDYNTKLYNQLQDAIGRGGGGGTPPWWEDDDDEDVVRKVQLNVNPNAPQRQQYGTNSPIKNRSDYSM